MRYNREQAVAYAKMWWDGRNPAFPSFRDDCTNFISQCLYAGGAPMRGVPNEASGWWMQPQKHKWSFSWSVAHSLRWYLETSKEGLVATRVSSPTDLELGDVIAYDFTGDGRIDHTTIVTSIQNGIPYVHAHTFDSENRPYHYRDSSAATPNMRYYYFHIADVFSM